MHATVTTRTLGFSLIEVLVAVVLTCIGLLGMVALQGRSLQYIQDSAQRNTAAALANDLVEMIRLRSAGQAVPAGYLKPAGASFPGTPADCANTPSAAEQQLACWALRAGALLPGARELLVDEFHICRSAAESHCAATGDVLEIQLAWRVRPGECLDRRAADPPEPICRYLLRTRI
ncbi:type IV pilus modification protein PilV [Pseudomonas sp. SCB32]|uniref:type IV pilus modification protein PilV n=1 Tax=Pseudomonas sp. SCB32 TaxID=2653853 RepID=UPI0021157576|nr:type IV pilus modification protein PilV [Pseudomonas sp. SCB32]